MTLSDAGSQAVSLGNADDSELQKGAETALQHHYMKSFITDGNRRRTVQQIQSEDRNQASFGPANPTVSVPDPAFRPPSSHPSRFWP
jgi:hypothetical protein